MLCFAIYFLEMSVKKPMPLYSQILHVLRRLKALQQQSLQGLTERLIIWHMTNKMLDFMKQWVSDMI